MQVTLSNTQAPTILTPILQSSSCAERTWRVAEFALKLFLTFTFITPIVLGIYELLRSKSVPNLHREQDSLLMRICYCFLLLPAINIGTQELWSTFSMKYFETATSEEIKRFDLEKLPAKHLSVILSRKEVVQSLSKEQFITFLLRNEFNKQILLSLLAPYNKLITVRSLNNEQVTVILRDKPSREAVMSLLSDRQAEDYVLQFQKLHSADVFQDGVYGKGTAKKLFCEFQKGLFLTLIFRLGPCGLRNSLLRDLEKNDPEIFESLIIEKSFISCLNNYMISTIIENQKLDIKKRMEIFGLLNAEAWKNEYILRAYFNIHSEQLYHLDQEAEGDFSVEQDTQWIEKSRVVFATFTNKELQKFVEAIGLDQFIFLFLSKKQLDSLNWQKVQFCQIRTSWGNEEEDLTFTKEYVEPSRWICSWANSRFYEMAKSQMEKVEDDDLYQLYRRVGGMLNKYLPEFLGLRYEKMVKKDGQNFLKEFLGNVRDSVRGSRSEKIEQPAAANRTSLPALEAPKPIPEEVRKAFDTFGVPSTSTWVQVKKEFYRMSKAMHPDKNENVDVAELQRKQEIFKIKISAYRILETFFNEN